MRSLFPLDAEMRPHEKRRIWAWQIDRYPRCSISWLGFDLLHPIGTGLSRLRPWATCVVDGALQFAEHREFVLHRRRAADDLFSMGLPERDPTGPADVAVLRWTFPYRRDVARKLLDSLGSRLTGAERRVLDDRDRVSVVRLHAHATSEGPDPVTVLWFWTDDDRNMRVAVSARDMAILSADALRVTPSAARYDFDEAAQ